MIGKNLIAFCFNKNIAFAFARSLELLVMVFNATFNNNITVISWQSVLLEEETGVSGENHRPAASHRQTLSLAAASRVHPFLLFTKPGANPCRIGDRLIGVVV
jgi:hypothetical protein